MGVLLLSSLVGSGLASTPVGAQASALPPTALAAVPKPKTPFLLLHQDGNRLYLEIPRYILGTDFLVSCHANSDDSSAHQPSSGGQCRETALAQVGWEKNPPAIWQLAQVGDSVEVRAAVPRRLPILRFGRDSAPVIDVSTLFLSRSLSQTAIRQVVVDSTQVEISLTQTTGASTAVLSWNLVRLPNRSVLKGRTHVDGPPLMCATRWLQKRDPWAASSDVITPIVYYVDSLIPRVLVPYIKRGIEAWNTVFEAMGLRHAIMAFGPGDTIPLAAAQAHASDDVVIWNGSNELTEAMSVPTDEIQLVPILGAWSIASVQVADTDITPMPYRMSGASALPVCDSMGIASAIITFANIIPTVQKVLFYSTAVALDPGIQEHAGWIAQCPVSDSIPGRKVYCPLPDSVIGSFIQLLATHEAGHALGLNHNFSGHMAYPTDSLRSTTFLDRMGLTPSIMGYGHRNYIAQLEDHLPLRNIMNGIGPYDRWAISWLYTPIPGAFTLEGEEPTLKRWLTAQDTAPYLRVQVEDALEANQSAVQLVGVDQVQAAEYRLRNLARVATKFEIRQNDVMSHWGAAFRGASYPGMMVLDSAWIAKVMHFYMEHLVLGHDPLLQAKGITWSSAPSGWDLDRWQHRRMILVNLVLSAAQTLVSSQEKRELRKGVCSEMTATLRALPTAVDSTTQVYMNAVRTQLTPIVTMCEGAPR